MPYLMGNRGTDQNSFVRGLPVWCQVLLTQCFSVLAYGFEVSGWIHFFLSRHYMFEAVTLCIVCVTGTSGLMSSTATESRLQDASESHAAHSWSQPFHFSYSCTPKMSQVFVLSLCLSGGWSDTKFRQSTLHGMLTLRTQSVCVLDA